MTITIQHGKYWSYTSGCRCDACREDFRLYQKSRNRERYAQTKANGLPEGVEHGASAYSNWGCRCDVCTAAWREKCRPYVAAYQARQKAKKAAAQGRLS